MTIKNSSFITFCSPHIQPHFKGIEFGRGNGRDSLWFSKNIQEYFGLDLSPEAVNTCRKYNLPNCTYIQSSFADSNLIHNNNSDLPSNYFDFVYSRFSYHSIQTTDVPNAHNNAKKLLKKNGLLFIETRCCSSYYCTKSLINQFSCLF
jgi:tellurite methyltransferase